MKLLFDNFFKLKLYANFPLNILKEYWPGVRNQKQLDFNKKNLKRKTLIASNRLSFTTKNSGDMLPTYSNKNIKLYENLLWKHCVGLFHSQNFFANKTEHVYQVFLLTNCISKFLETFKCGNLNCSKWNSRHEGKQKFKPSKALKKNWN